MLASQRIIHDGLIDGSFGPGPAHPDLNRSATLRIGYQAQRESWRPTATLSLRHRPAGTDCKTIETLASRARRALRPAESRNSGMIALAALLIHLRRMAF